MVLTYPFITSLSCRPNASIQKKSSFSMSADEYTIAILGDLHLDPRFMDGE